MMTGPDYTPKYRGQIVTSESLAKALAKITENGEIPLQIFQERHKDGYHYVVLSVTAPPVPLAPPTPSPLDIRPRVIPARSMTDLRKGGPSN